MKPHAPISTQNLSPLPNIHDLKRLFQSLAMLDAIMMDDWESRYYSFNSTWSDGEQMASMRNGSGDHLFALFTPSGAIMKGFAHESPMSSYRTEPPRPWPGVLDDVLSEFAAFLTEPAFNIDYERHVPLAAIKHVYQQRPLTEKIVEKLNRDLSLDDLEDDIEEIGYPT